jgi:hypothetical protein
MLVIRGGINTPDQLDSYQSPRVGETGLLLSLLESFITLFEEAFRVVEKQLSKL